MRTIKFREWDKELKKMSYQDDASSLSAWWDSIDDTSVLMQFTGLLDKNGKEIYEGDIVTKKHHVKNSTVQWNETNCSFNIRKPIGSTEQWKIIGNIYENPELLPSKKESNQE